MTTFLYGPTSTDSISHQLANLSAASRAAGTSAVDILAAQLQSQLGQLPLTPRSSHSPVSRSSRTELPPASHSTHTQLPPASHSTHTQLPPASHSTHTQLPPVSRSSHTPVPPYPATTHSSASTSLVRYQEPSQRRSSSPVNTTVLEWRGRPKPERTDTDTTSMTGPTSYGMKSSHTDLYCLYASDLQRHPSQELSASITSDPVPYCPHCKRTLHLSPGKAWEVLKNEDGYERCFQVSNRFVVKCHRGGADGQYSCVLCSRHADVVSVCGDVKALIKHVWEDHNIAELKHEEDITEVVELASDRRRDSGIGYSTSRGSRRSASVGPSSWRSRPVYD